MEDTVRDRPDLIIHSLSRSHFLTCMQSINVHPRPNPTYLFVLFCAFMGHRSTVREFSFFDDIDYIKQT